MSITINGATNTLTAASGLAIAGNTAVTGTLSATGKASIGGNSSSSDQDSWLDFSAWGAFGMLGGNAVTSYVGNAYPSGGVWKNKLGTFGSTRIDHDPGAGVIRVGFAPAVAANASATFTDMATFSSTGLAVTGTLSATAADNRLSVTSTGVGQTVGVDLKGGGGGGSDFNYIQSLNSANAQQWYIGGNGAANQLAFKAGTTLVGTFSSTGLAVTGTGTFSDALLQQKTGTGAAIIETYNATNGVDGVFVANGSGGIVYGTPVGEIGIGSRSNAQVNFLFNSTSVATLDSTALTLGTGVNLVVPGSVKSTGNVYTDQAYTASLGAGASADVYSAAGQSFFIVTAAGDTDTSQYAKAIVYYNSAVVVITTLAASGISITTSGTNKISVTNSATPQAIRWSVLKIQQL